MSEYLRQSMTNNLLTLIEQDCGQGRRSGRYWKFHCPFPGHTRGDLRPSLAVTPDNDWWHCFTCGRSGDSIGWLMKFHDLSFPEALKSLGIDGSFPRKQRPVKAPPENRLPTNAFWQERGMEFVAEAETIMWSSEGQAALNYLHKRGLKDGTIKRYRLGFCPVDKYEQADAWGYPSESGKVWLPKGIIIPNINRKTLWSINIRRPSSTPKYIKVKGSRNALFGADNLVGADIGLLCEGEFDCMLADQEIGDAIGVATLGGASQRLDLVIWGPYLMRLQTIFVVYDSDSAGVRGAEDLAHLGSRLKRIILPDGNWKDINDYILAGGDLRSWLLYQLNKLAIPFEILENPVIHQPAYEITQVQTIDLNYWQEIPWQIDITRPCFSCGDKNYQAYEQGNGYFCATCHPLVRN